uniref:Uncharacterized protein n=1 Tax=Strongyloides papillosus TaxID=174720 RepID=A0A0N5C208_STREA
MGIRRQILMKKANPVINTKCSRKKYNLYLKLKVANPTPLLSGITTSQQNLIIFANGQSPKQEKDISRTFFSNQALSPSISTPSIYIPSSNIPNSTLLPIIDSNGNNNVGPGTKDSHGPNVQVKKHGRPRTHH